MKTRLLELNDLTFKRSRGFVLGPINLSLTNGECIGIIGKNGSGKSTLMSLISGVIIPDQGNISKNSNYIGCAFQKPIFYENLSIIENINLFFSTIDIDYNIVDNLLKKFGLIDSKYKKFRTLSLGMQKRLEIVTAQINDPDILIFDEPFDNLDVMGREVLSSCLEEYIHRGKGIIIVSHMFNTIENICSKVLALECGQQKFLGSIKTFKSKYNDFNDAIK